MPSTTKAWLRVKNDIQRYMRNPTNADRLLALRADWVSNPKEESSMARKATKKKGKRKGGRKKRRTAAQKAATAKMQRAAARSRRKKSGGTRRKSRKSRKGGRRKATRRKSSSRRRTRVVKTEKVRIVRVPAKGTQAVKVQLTRRSGGKKRRKGGKRRKKNPTPAPLTGTELAKLQDNPTGALDGLFSNPMGPFSRQSIVSYGSAILGVGLGLVAADFGDRVAATRTPADSTPEAGTARRPWYGRDAAAAIRRRPDAIRLGVQAGGAVVAMILAYLTRRGRTLPWLFGGVSVGFGANLLQQLTTWWVMPMLLKVPEDKPGEESLANRLYSLEQGHYQDEVDKVFENWGAVPALSAGQAETPQIQAPVPAGGAGFLGKGRSGKQANGQLAAADLERARSEGFFLTGRLGKCASCGGQGGCWASCHDLGEDCGPCAGPGIRDAKQCRYTVCDSDNLYVMAQAASVDINAVAALNGGGTPDSFWIPGNGVVLPYSMCKYIEKRDNGGGMKPPISVPPGGPSAFPAVPGMPSPPGAPFGTPSMPMTPGAFPPVEQPAQAIPAKVIDQAIPSAAPVSTMVYGVGDAEKEQRSLSLFGDENTD